MMIGEFDFGTIFLAAENVDPNVISPDDVYYRPAAYIIFTLFLVIMTILIMNLLVSYTIYIRQVMRYWALMCHGTLTDMNSLLFIRPLN